MSKQQETILTTHMEGFQDFEVDFGKYEISFRRWIVSQLDGNHMSVQEIRDRFHLSRSHYWDILKRWQERYSEPLHRGHSIPAVTTRNCVVEGPFPL
ncbi:hypothetical protein D1164_17455 [Mariniphaga sediminis]|uniref:Helix-turn-helix domain-containing protein n=1 Tax=Mariniphaga sediminis TaxID=1628158 RepID=A0A399CVZ0_9BACT|nr:hypothetical protein D1164_17455 [Mariniphaga sediminis]